MTLQGSLSFRSVPKAVKIFFKEIPDLNNSRVPSFTTVQRWVAAVGYFKLERPKVLANDWQVIIDLSIQLGTQKCLTVLGCRRTDLKPGRALNLQDLEPLMVRILNKVNGPAIKDALETVRKKVGHIQVICSDEGPDVMAGVRLYKEEHPEAIHIPDIAHKMANLLKYRLKDDPTWQAFCSKASELKISLQQTEFAAITPPAQRSKARFMNADILVDWASKMLCLLDNPQEISDIDMKHFETHLGWLRKYRDAIEHYTRLIQVAALARHLVRTLGVCTAMVKEFETEVFGFKLSISECQFVGEVLDFLQEQADKTTDIGTFVGSSEILESFFGKFKSMEGDQCKAGFTGLVLAAHAHIGDLKEETITEALSTATTNEVNKWIKTQVGPTTQSKRKKLFKSAKKILKKYLGQELTGTLEEEAVGF